MSATAGKLCDICRRDTASSFGDIDNDGDQDIFQEIGGANTGDLGYSALFENPGFDNHWVTLLLQGRRSNRAAMGARIRVRVDTPDGERDIWVLAGTGGSFGSSSLQQEIGLGDATAIRKIEVTWPTSEKITQTFEDVPMDRFYRMVEGEATLTPLERRSFKLGGQ